MDKKAILKKAVKILLVLGLAGCLFLFLINLYMIRKEKPNIISSDDAAALGDVDCIMVLAAVSGRTVRLPACFGTGWTRE